MPFPYPSYAIYGTISGFVTTVGVTITAWNKTTAEYTSAISDANSQYLIDCANMLPEGYTNGDVIAIAVNGIFVTTTVDTVGFPAGKQVNISPSYIAATVNKVVVS